MKLSITLSFAVVVATALLLTGHIASHTVHAVHTVIVDCVDSGTMEQGRDAVRALQPLNDSVVVMVFGECARSAATLELSGSKDSAPFPYTITYQASSGPNGATPGRLSGGQKISSWGPASDPNIPMSNFSVYMADLTGFDFGPLGVGHFFNGGLGGCAQSRAELFWNGMPMELARYPNVPVGGGPWMNWMTISAANVNDTIVGGTSRSQFPRQLPECNEDQIHTPAARRQNLCSIGSKQQATTTTTFAAQSLAGDAINSKLSSLEQDAWLHGFWTFDWADNYIKLESAKQNPAGSNTWDFTYDSATPPVYGIKEGARFYIVNALSELDSPGEYYINSTSLQLYFIPPNNGLAPNQYDEAVISLSTEPLISQNAADPTPLSYVKFDSLPVQYGRGQGINLGNVDHVEIKNCVVSNFGRDGIALNGQNTLISGLHSRGCGCTAVGLSGGNPATLQESNVTISDSDIAFYARWTRTYNPGVHFAGVGIQVIRNRIGYAPHNGLLGGGNNHRFIRNYLYQLCYEVLDSGAFYIGRSWIDRGMVLDGNTFFNISKIEPTVLGSPFVHAIYFDDEQSGVMAVNNLCQHCDNCFIVGGGRDNLVNGNRCEHIKTSCVQMDNRGMNWQHNYCEKGGNFWQQLASVNYTFPPYSLEYPAIVNTEQDQPCVPVGNTYIGNSYCGVAGGQGFIDQTSATLSSWGTFASENNGDNNC